MNAKPRLAYGLFIGTLVGLPPAAAGLAYGQATVPGEMDVMFLTLLSWGWGVGLAYTYRRMVPKDLEAGGPIPRIRSVERIGRRQFLITLSAASASITVAGASLAALLSRQAPGRERPEEASSNPGDQHPPLPNAGNPVRPAPGTRPEYIPLENHYKVSIRLEPSIIDGEARKLPIEGLVDRPLILTLDDLQSNYALRDRYVTISCISGRIPTTLIGTTLWTGVSLQEILAQARIRPEARYLRITSADGFYETLDLDLVDSDERIMLCYAWDGKPLPEGHGYPLRIWIPDRYGMKQPKWITAIEAISDYQPGFRVERGWDRIAQVKTTSVIDTVAVDRIIEDGEQALVPMGGMAFSGARGISKVEGRVDEGEWREAPGILPPQCLSRKVRRLAGRKPVSGRAEMANRDFLFEEAEDSELSGHVAP